MRLLVIALAAIIGLIAGGLAMVALQGSGPPQAERLAVPRTPAQAAPAQAAPVASRRAAVPLRHQPAEPERHRPGSAVPVAIADPAVYDVHWDDGHGRSWRTRVVIHTDGDGLRRRTDITTREAHADSDQVVYRGTAFLDRDGHVHIDARGAMVAGSYAADWSPDSFVIAPDLSVVIQDDRHDASSGHVTQITR